MPRDFFARIDVFFLADAAAVTRPSISLGSPSAYQRAYYDFSAESVVIPTPVPAGATQSGLWGIACPGTSACFAVGDATDPTALQQLGQLYIGLGEWNRAVIPLERVVAYAPSDEAYIALATTYKALNRPGDAVVLLQRALEVSPDREDAMAYLGSTLADVGRGREAVAPLEEAMRRGVNSAFIYGTLALAYAQAGEDGQRRTRPDAADLDQLAKQFALLRGSEAV